MRLIGIGLVAGFFSALFGVGGGLVAVPLLIMVAALPPHAATATSLGAIGITALDGDGPVCRPGRSRRGRLRAARRASRRRRGGARHEPAAAHLGPGARARVRSVTRRGCAVAAPVRSGGSGRDGTRRRRRLADRRRARARPRGGRPRRSLRDRRRAALRADAHLARPRSARGGGDVAARDPADGRRRRVAAAPATATCATARRSWSGSRRSRPSRLGVLVAKALPEHTLQSLFAVLMLLVAAQLAWRSR